MFGRIRRNSMWALSLRVGVSYGFVTRCSCSSMENIIQLYEGFFSCGRFNLPLNNIQPLGERIMLLNLHSTCFIPRYREEGGREPGWASAVSSSWVQMWWWCVMTTPTKLTATGRPENPALPTSLCVSNHGKDLKWASYFWCPPTQTHIKWQYRHYQAAPGLTIERTRPTFDH